MKSKITVVLIFFCSILSFGQSKTNNYENDIKKSLGQFAQSIKTKNINYAVESIYPKFFTIVSKDQMKQILNFTYNNPALDIRILDFKVNDVENPEKINKDLFSIVNYSTKMNLKVDWNAIPNGQNMKKQINDGLYKKFGKENITYIPKSDLYLINSKMKACAVSGNGKDWKFVIVEESYKKQLSNILPKKILDKF